MFYQMAPTYDKTFLFQNLFLYIFLLMYFVVACVGCHFHFHLMFVFFFPGLLRFSACCLVPASTTTSPMSENLLHRLGPPRSPSVVFQSMASPVDLLLVQGPWSGIRLAREVGTSCWLKDCWGCGSSAEIFFWGTAPWKRPRHAVSRLHVGE